MACKNVITVGLVLVMNTLGCAALFVEGPPANRDPRVQPTCTTSKGWVYLDDVFGIANAVSFWVYDDIQNDTGIDQTPEKIGAVAGAVIHGVSSLVGEQRVKACRKAHAEYEAYVVEGLPDEAPKLPEQMYWCTSGHVDPSFGACNKTRSVCETSRRRLIETGNAMRDCERKAVVDCFAMLREGERKVGCAPTLDACVRARQQRITDADGPIEISECARAGERRPLVRIEPVVTPQPPVEPPEEPPTESGAQHCVTIDGRESCFETAEECAEGRAAALPMFSIGECVSK